MKRLIVTIMLIGWFAAAGAALAQPDQIHSIPEFTFESGQKLQNMNVGYSTHGTLNSDKSNAILITHGTSQNRNVYNSFIGPGKALDTDKYYVVAVDGIGAGFQASRRTGSGSDSRDTRFATWCARSMIS
jgi:homoserine O-acetyltransferase